MQIPYALNHIAISVPDVVAASKWYVDVLGFHELRPPHTTDRAVTPDDGLFKMYPPDLQKVTMAYLSAGNGIGVELFEFQEPRIAPEARADFARDYKRGGYFHMAVTAPDVEALCERAVAAGARKIGATIPVFEYEAIYIEDPWGNVVELISASFERMMSNRA